MTLVLLALVCPVVWLWASSAHAAPLDQPMCKHEKGKLADELPDRTPGNEPCRKGFKLVAPPDAEPSTSQDPSTGDEPKDVAGGNDTKPAADFDTNVKAVSKRASDFATACNAKPDPDADADAEAKVRGLCTAYCGTVEVDYCALADKRIAAVALAVAAEDVAEVESKLATLPKFDELAKRDPTRYNASFGELSGDLADLGMRLAVALGKLALDRAKQEAVIWALDQLQRNICSPKNEALGHELSSYWLHHTCSFANAKVLDSSYGAGNDMLANLVASINNDLRRMPGNVAGLVVGIAYWTEATESSVSNMFACYRHPSPAGCGKTHTLRVAAADAVTAMIDGDAPVFAYAHFATRFDELNRRDAGARKVEFGGRFDAPALQVSTCAGSLAAYLSLDEHRMSLPPSVAQVDSLERVVAGLIDSPACWSLVGKGYANVGEALKPNPTLRLAAERAGGQDIERLSSVIRIIKLLHTHKTGLRSHWRELDRLARELQTSVAKHVERLDSLDQPEAKGGAKQRRVEVATAALGIVGQSLDIADQVTRLLHDTLAVLESSDAQLYKLIPGLMPELEPSEPSNPALGTWAKCMGDRLDKAQTSLELGRGLVRAGVALTREDYATAMNEVTAAAGQIPSRQDFRCPTPTDTDTDTDTASLRRGSGKAKQAPATQGGKLEALLAEVQNDLNGLNTELDTFAKKGSGPRAVNNTDMLTKLVAFEANLAKVAEKLRQAKDDWTAASPKDKQAVAEQLATVERLYGDLAARVTAVTINHSVLDKLLEFSGLIVAIIQAEDADALAAVLAKTTSPPGAWRRKQVPGSRTLSLTSFVGLQLGAEWRRGQYGATFEKGDIVYFQAPTLALPIGFDLAFGDKRRVSHGVFVPLIDPAAFLQYDSSQSSRLPGPRPLTVFALGAMYRLGIPTTPLAVLIGYIYRPMLRTWEATVNDPGADAHQLAFMLAVDATLWTIVKR